MPEVYDDSSKQETKTTQAYSLLSIHPCCNAFPSISLNANPLSYLAYSINLSVSIFAPASVCAHIATLNTFSPLMLRMPGGMG